MSADAIDFSQLIPLFPLPNCVLFPGVVQPLHIFEPRYQEMLAFVLEGQSLIAMGLLKAGWEKGYYGTPAIHEMVCVGKVIAHERLEDGKANLLLHGVVRAVVEREERCGAFRTVKLRPMFDGLPSAGEAHVRVQRKVIAELIRGPLKELTVAASLEPLLDDSLSTPQLVDVLAHSIVQDVLAKQQMLEELDPVKRGEFLLREMVKLAGQLGNQAAGLRKSTWPPPLSVN